MPGPPGAIEKAPRRAEGSYEATDSLTRKEKPPGEGVMCISRSHPQTSAAGLVVPQPERPLSTSVGCRNSTASPWPSTRS